jgi:protein-L-isoaspartate(D-aspartate) O-methyltransferase
MAMLDFLTGRLYSGHRTYANVRLTTGEPPMNDAELQAAKEEMLRCQLQQRGIDDPRVLAAMARVPRERFVPAAEQDCVYADRALPIDCGQTISQPYMVALMTQALGLSGQELVLEIGTGSGYQTAILAELAREVISIERHAALTAQAQAALSERGCANITLLTGDGTLGWPPRAPYDRIIVTAAAATCPPPLFEQLAERGVLVIPIGGKGHQTLQAIHKEDGQPRPVVLSGCRFVPLKGSAGWPE